MSLKLQRSTQPLRSSIGTSGHRAERGFGTCLFLGDCAPEPGLHLVWIGSSSHRIVTACDPAACVVRRSTPSPAAPTPSCALRQKGRSSLKPPPHVGVLEAVTQDLLCLINHLLELLKNHVS